LIISELYAALKSVPSSEIEFCVNEMIESVGLIGKSIVQAKNLSGGMKRKLCVGIALIGDSKIVFLVSLMKYD